MATWDAPDKITFETGKVNRVSALIQIPSETTHKNTGTQVNNNIFLLNDYDIANTTFRFPVVK